MTTTEQCEDFNFFSFSTMHLDFSTSFASVLGMLDIFLVILFLFHHFLCCSEKALGTVISSSQSTVVTDNSFSFPSLSVLF